MLYTMEPLLNHALENHYAVMAPSIRNEDCARAAIEVAEEMHSPIILNVNRHAWAGMLDVEYWKYQMEVLRQIASRASVPAAINLDHSPSYKECADAIVCGFTSVMIDKSDKEFNENVEQTKEVVKIAHAVGVSVEAEIGHVGFADLKSVEGVIRNDAQKESMAHESKLTVPAELKEFVEKTGVDCVAVSIGNQHGAYKNNEKPRIELGLLDELHAACPNIPLVLHGGSGTGDEVLSEACRRGVCKVNVGTELEKAAAMAVVNTFNEKGCVTAVYNVAREGYKKEIYHHVKVLGSEGKAW